MKKFVQLLPIAGVTVIVWLCAATFAQQSSWLSYFPSVVRLQGRLITVTKYGYPTYGAEPDNDEKIEVPILILQTPIRVRANPLSTANYESMTNISFVQLIFSDESGATLRRYLDQQIVAAGTLAIGNRGGQFTEIVMTVKAVNPTGKPL